MPRYQTCANETFYILGLTGGPGAMVITNHLNFFIGVSSEKIEVDGAEVFGISTNAPIYKMMQGMGKGDKFRFNKKEYKIEDVY